jgi:chorismate mutase
LEFGRSQPNSLFISSESDVSLYKSLKRDILSVLFPTLPNFPPAGKNKAMNIPAWRAKIDELDRKLVELISQRAEAAHAIGRLKRGVQMPVYEPDREQAVFENVKRANPGPLSDDDLIQIYERLMFIMRRIQHEETSSL